MDLDTQKKQSHVRYEWYQSSNHVVITLYIKNLSLDQIHLSIQPHSVSFSCSHPVHNDYELHLDLAYRVDPSQCTHQVYSTKVEIELMKEDASIQWSKLEREATDECGKGCGLSTSIHEGKDSSEVLEYPSSARNRVNWDRFSQELEKEETSTPTGDDALTKLFQQIYSQGNDETRRAMIKSFTESGGTCLSTNWQDVASRTVDIQPPEGLEAKKFDM